VLTQFDSAGIVERHHFEGGHSVFEIKDSSHHDHIVCTNCGKVVEFKDEVIEERQNKMAATLGFELTDHSLYLYGICSDCLHASKK
jgi:Fur family ferric uptake transcriptional regulator